MQSLQMEGNQIALPEVITQQFPQIKTFDVSTDGETIFLRPSRVVSTSPDEIREHFDRLGITDQDIEEAVEEARTEAWQNA